VWTDLAEAFRGVTVTTVTPSVSQTLDRDITGFDANLRFLRGSGVSVIVPAGVGVAGAPPRSARSIPPRGETEVDMA
jgi:hypothetical protein